MAGRSVSQVSPVTSEFLYRFRLPIVVLVPAVITLFCLSPARAEIRVVASQGEHRMGDRDTKEDAVRLATEAAKRDALEQVATYLESVTVVEGLEVTKDEIHTYTAGLVLVLDQQTNLTLEGDTVVVKVNLTAQVDTEEIAQAISALRENEDARTELIALKKEIDGLHQELETANQALAQASTVDQVEQASQQRQDILNRVQSNAMASQAWTDWVLVSPVVYPYPWVGVAQTQSLLSVARGLYPTSPHVQVAQQIIVTRQPPIPPQPLAPSVPGSAPPSMGSQTVPRTLNEISHDTPTGPQQIGNQPMITHQIQALPASRTLTDVRQSNPLLPAPNGTSLPAQQLPPPGSRSVQAMQQFLQPPATTPAGQPPIARRLPPTLNQLHPSLPHQVPRVPHQIAPRGFGGGGRGGGGWHHGGGGHGGGRGGGGRGR